MSTNITTFILILISIIDLTNSQPTANNCLSCAESSSSNYQCWSPTMFTNPWEIQCCNKGDSRSKCAATPGVQCSIIVGNNAGAYYSKCPQMNKEQCGLQYNYNDMNLYTEGGEWKTFRFGGLRWKTKGYKTATYQVCSYNIMNPPGGYTGGKVILKVNQPDSGVKLYLEQNGKTIEPTFGN
jgi:hypothetical protein